LAVILVAMVSGRIQVEIDWDVEVPTHNMFGVGLEITWKFFKETLLGTWVGRSIDIVNVKWCVTQLHSHNQVPIWYGSCFHNVSRLETGKVAVHHGRNPGTSGKHRLGLFTVLVTDKHLGLKLALDLEFEVCTVMQISKSGFLNTRNVVLVQMMFNQPMTFAFSLDTPHIHRQHFDVGPLGQNFSTGGPSTPST
jgi:hypothetical protein